MAANRLGFKHKKVQRLRRLLRNQSLREAEGVFVSEGVKLLDEAIASKSDIEAIYIAPDWSPKASELAERGRCRVHVLDDGVLERIAGTVTPQPVLSVVRYATHTRDDLKPGASCAVLADVRDPGNAGTILRSAEASGMDAVIFCEGSVDPYNPKTVRSSAGAIFHVPVITGVAIDDALEILAHKKIRTFGTAADGAVVYSNADLRQPCAIVIGNEANGLQTQVQQKLDEMISIPIIGRSESLNAGVSFAVVAFEVARQRRGVQ